MNEGKPKERRVVVVTQVASRCSVCGRTLNTKLGSLRAVQCWECAFVKRKATKK